MAGAIKSELDDEEYECVSDYSMSEPESDIDDENEHDETGIPRVAPAAKPKLRPSDLKTLHCPYEDCSKIFNRKARLDEHLRSHTNTRPFKCSHCPKDFLRDSHLKHHVKSAHSTVRDYTCSYNDCGKSFATGTRLRRHEATHIGHDKYRCTGYEGCNQTFRKKETLNRHILQFHQQTDPFPCTEVDAHTGKQCAKTFTTTDKLKSHKRAMHDPTKFSCALCLQTLTMAYRESSGVPISAFAYFSTYAELKKHMEDVHPPTCPHCMLRFKTAKELSRHLDLVHNIVDPNSLVKTEAHECPYADCNRSFSKKGNLNVHIKTVHEKRRDFVCGQTEVSLAEIASDVELIGCGRDFTSKGTLEEHIRTTHLGMEAKRVERNKKRKVEKQEEEDELGISPKKRRARKDKGVRKTLAIESLVQGFPLYRRGSIVEADDIDSDDDTQGERRVVYHRDEDDEDSDNSDEEGLTGSMVMHGSQLFHGDETYHFDSASSSFSVTTKQPDGLCNDHKHTESALTEPQWQSGPGCLLFNPEFHYTDRSDYHQPPTMSPLALHQHDGLPIQPNENLFDKVPQDLYALQQQQQLNRKRIPIDPRLSSY